MKKRDSNNIRKKLDRLERQVAELRSLLIAVLILLCAIAFGVSDILVGIVAMFSVLGFFVGLPVWLLTVHYRSKAEVQDDAAWEELSTDGLPEFIRGTEPKQ